MITYTDITKRLITNNNKFRIKQIESKTEENRKPFETRQIKVDLETINFGELMWQ